MSTLEVEIRDTYLGIEPEAWDQLVAHHSPFLESTYLFGLERFQCAHQPTGWVPRPVLVFRDGTLVGAAPGWIKLHSMGEFVYDHSWAQASEQAGLAYYPKFVVAVPFTPVSGQRLLGAEDEQVYEALLRGLKTAAAGCYGSHILFPTLAETTRLEQRGWCRRYQFQFHWTNHNYRDFEHFLQTFKSKKRNKIRRERKNTSHFKLRVVDYPSKKLLSALHRFHSNTCEQFAQWGRVYLSKAFFHHLGEQWGHRLLPVVAFKGDEPAAGAFNVYKNGVLYGRYWGSDVQANFLHFEVAYYQAIELCIARQFHRFEPGHGGWHKYRRGFKPSLTYSNHHIKHPGLFRAIQQFCKEEEASVRSDVQQLTERSEAAKPAP